jgi:hypothetical protein
MDQDWTPVVLTKTAKQKAAGLSSAHAIAQAKMSGAVSTEVIIIDIIINIIPV